MDQVSSAQIYIPGGSVTYNVDWEDEVVNIFIIYFRV